MLVCAVAAYAAPTFPLTYSGDHRYLVDQSNAPFPILVAYVPPAHSGSISVDMAAMGGPARGRWVDPTSGAFRDIGTRLSNAGVRSFAPPGRNSAGDNDWVLLLEFPDSEPVAERRTFAGGHAD